MDVTSCLLDFFYGEPTSSWRPPLINRRTAAFAAITLSFLYVASGCGDSATQGSDLNTEWRLVDETDGIATYWRHRADSRQKTFRGVGTFASERPFAVLSAMGSGDLAAYFESVARIDVLEEDPSGRWVSHTKVNLPWPAEDRELYVEARLQQDPETYEAVLTFESVNERYPATEGVQQIPEYKGALRVLPLDGGRVRLSLEMVCDPGEPIPAALTDRLTRSMPYYALRYMQGVMARPENQNYVLPLLREPGT